MEQMENMNVENLETPEQDATINVEPKKYDEFVKRFKEDKAFSKKVVIAAVACVLAVGVLLFALTGLNRTEKHVAACVEELMHTLYEPESIRLEDDIVVVTVKDGSKDSIFGREHYGKVYVGISYSARGVSVSNTNQKEYAYFIDGFYVESPFDTNFSNSEEKIDAIGTVGFGEICLDNPETEKLPDDIESATLVDMKKIAKHLKIDYAE